MPAKKGCKSNLPEEYRKNGGPGRGKGTPNKVTRDMKVQVWRVFEALEADEDKSLAGCAKANPPWFHSVFSSRIIPKDVNVRVIEKLDDLSEEEIASLREDLRKRIEGPEEG